MGWEITLRAPSGLLVGSLWDPAAGAHLVTATVTVEGERRALLPGSSLRGALREALRRFALARGAGECTDQPDCPCPACALFGAADRPGKLRVHSALFPARLDLRAGVAIDRVLRTAWREGGALWTERRAVGEAVVRVDVLQRLTDREGELLEAFWAWLEATGLSVGQRKSVGAGALDVRVRRTEERARAVSSPPPGRRRPYALRVVLLEPAHLVGHRQRDFYREALDVIPTSTLRGAIGRALEMAGAPALARDLLLGPRPLLFGPGLPVDPASPPGRAVVWTSRRRCRGSPAHLVDVAIPTTAVALGAPSALGGCPLCPAALGEADRPPVTPLVLGHTRIDPATRRAQEGGLHFQVAAAPGAAFEARALLSDGEAELLACLGEVVVGGRRARGMGRAALTVHELPDPPPIRERVARTREALEAHGARPDRAVAILGILSDAGPGAPLGEILRARQLRPLAGEVRSVERGGWDELAGKPRALREIVAAGSWVAVELGDDVVDELERLEQEGVPDPEEVAPLLVVVRDDWEVVDVDGESSGAVLTDRDRLVQDVRQLCRSHAKELPERAQLHTILRYAQQTNSVEEVALFIEYQASRKELSRYGGFLRKVAGELRARCAGDPAGARDFLGLVVRAAQVERGKG